MNNHAQTKEQYQNTIFFPIGAPNDAYAQYFVGQSYLAPVSTEQVPVFNVTFEPGCRNNWHIHHAAKDGGQLLICTAGSGWCQWTTAFFQPMPIAGGGLRHLNRAWHGGRLSGTSILVGKDSGQL